MCGDYGYDFALEKTTDGYRIAFPESKKWTLSVTDENNLLFRYEDANGESTRDYTAACPSDNDFNTVLVRFITSVPEAQQQLSIGDKVNADTPFSVALDPTYNVRDVYIVGKTIGNYGFHLYDICEESWNGITLYDNNLTVTGGFVSADGYYGKSFVGNTLAAIKYNCAHIEAYCTEWAQNVEFVIQQHGAGNYEVLVSNSWSISTSEDGTNFILHYENQVENINVTVPVSSCAFDMAYLLFKEPAIQLEKNEEIKSDTAYEIELASIPSQASPNTAIAYIRGEANQVLSSEEAGLSIDNNTVTLDTANGTQLTGAKYVEVLTNADILEFTETPTLLSRFRTAVVSLFVDVARADSSAKQLLVYQNASDEYIAYDTKETLNKNTNGTLSTSDGKLRSSRNVEEDPLSNVVLVFNAAEPEEDNPPIDPIKPKPTAPSYPKYYPDYDEPVTVQPAPEAPAAEADEYVVVCRRLNVRRTPSTRYARIGRISRGDVVKVVEWVGKWAKIEWKDGTAYVHGNYISPVD